MTKLVRRAVLIIVTAIVAIGCASSPDPVLESERPEVAQPSFRIIEHKNSTLGGDVPDWTTMDIGALEDDPRFEGRFVFRFEETGESLEGTRLVAENMSAPVEVARIVSTRVEQAFVGAQVGDQDLVETYFENVVQVVAEAEISGLRKYGDFWVLKEYIESDGSAGDREYAYYTLYTIEESIVDDLVERAIDGLDAETEEEQTARERVREIVNQGL